MKTHHPGMVGMKTVVCQHCKKTFKTKRASMFCSRICKDLSYNKKYDKPGKLRNKRVEEKWVKFQ